MLESYKIARSKHWQVVRYEPDDVLSVVISHDVICLSAGAFDSQ